MGQLFGFLLFVGCVLFIFGGVSFLIKKVKPAEEPRNGRPVAVTANEIARNFQTLAVPTMLGAGVLILIGLVGLLVGH
jgi:hypothetical protein